MHTENQSFPNMLNTRKFVIESIFPMYGLCAIFYKYILEGAFQDEVDAISTYVVYAYMAFMVFGTRSVAKTEDSTISRRGLLEALLAFPFIMVVAVIMLIIIMYFGHAASEFMASQSRYTKFAIYSGLILAYWHWLYKIDLRIISKNIEGRID